MQPGFDEALDHDPTYRAIRATLLSSYSGTLAGTQLRPLEVMVYIATAMGSLYREVAGVHTGPDACACGWEPCGPMDIIALQQALAITALPDEEPVDTGLLNMTPVGHG